MKATAPLWFTAAIVILCCSAVSVYSFVGVAVENFGTGKILRTVDGGNTWENAWELGTGYYFERVYIVDLYTIVAFGQNGLILGTSAPQLDLRNTTNNTCTNVLNDDDGMISSVCSNISTNSTIITPWTGTASSTNVNSGTIYSNWINRSVDNTLGTLFERDFRAISFRDSNNGIAVGSTGLMYFTSNGGISWKETVTPLNATIRDFNGASLVPNSLVGYVCGAVGTLLKTTDGGITWRTLNSSVSSNLYAIAAYDDYTVVMAGSRGVVAYSLNGGDTWTTVAIRPLFPIDSNNTDSPLRYRYTSFSPVLLDIKWLGNRVYVSGSSSVMLTSSTANLNLWSQVNAGVFSKAADAFSIHSLSFLKGGDGLSAFAGGQSYVYTCACLADASCPATAWTKTTVLDVNQIGGVAAIAAPVFYQQEAWRIVTYPNSGKDSNGLETPGLALEVSASLTKLIEIQFQNGGTLPLRIYGIVFPSERFTLLAAAAGKDRAELNVDYAPLNTTTVNAKDTTHTFAIRFNGTQLAANKYTYQIKVLHNAPTVSTIVTVNLIITDAVSKSTTNLLSQIWWIFLVAGLLIFMTVVIWARRRLAAIRKYNRRIKDRRFHLAFWKCSSNRRLWCCRPCIKYIPCCKRLADRMTPLARQFQNVKIRREESSFWDSVSDSEPDPDSDPEGETGSADPLSSSGPMSSGTHGTKKRKHGGKGRKYQREGSSRGSTVLSGGGTAGGGSLRPRAAAAAAAFAQRSAQNNNEQSSSGALVRPGSGSVVLPRRVPGSGHGPRQSPTGVGTANHHLDSSGGLGLTPRDGGTGVAAAAVDHMGSSSNLGDGHNMDSAGRLPGLHEESDTKNG